jgi:predicted nucleic acid-binding protein
MRCVLDTTVVVLVCRPVEDAVASDGALAKKAHEWVRSLPPTTTLILPAPAIGEFLYGLADPSRIDDALEKITRRFEIGPFDVLAARWYAEVARNIVGAPSQRPQDWRRHKVDMQVISIAAAVRADLLVTEDLDQRKWAGRWVKATAIPDPPPQPLRLPGLL